MATLLQKMRGDGAALPPRLPAKALALAGLGGFLAILLVASLTDTLHLPLVLGSFGASCVLVFGYPDAPFSQPRNVVGGHFISSLVGLACLWAFGPHGWTVALSVGLSIVLMMVTRTVHPPAGSNPVIVYLSQPGWVFLLTPTLIGALLIVLFSLFYNNLTRPTNYPKYW